MRKPFFQNQFSGDGLRHDHPHGVLHHDLLRGGHDDRGDRDDRDGHHDHDDDHADRNNHHHHNNSRHRRMRIE